jgi:hypothetical protein
MKRALVYLIICLWVWSPFVAHAIPLTVFLGGSPPAVAGRTYLLNESFDTVTGYDNTWTETGTATINEDYNLTILEGTQSLFIDATTQTTNVNSGTFTATSPIHCYFLFRPTTIPASTAGTVFRLRNSTTALATLQITSTGKLRVLAVGGTTQDTTDAVSAGNTYHVFFTYTLGTGADAVATVGFSTDGTKPSSGTKYKESTNGTSTSSCDNVTFGYTSTNTFGFIVDKLRVDDVAFTEAP